MPEETKPSKTDTQIAAIMQCVEQQAKKLNAAAEAIVSLGQALREETNIRGVGIHALVQELKGFIIEETEAKVEERQSLKDKEEEPDITESQVITEMAAEHERDSSGGIDQTKGGGEVEA